MLAVIRWISRSSKGVVAGGFRVVDRAGPHDDEQARILPVQYRFDRAPTPRYQLGASLVEGYVLRKNGRREQRPDSADA